MKLHRHTLGLAGRPYTVVTLRPGTDARFSTNFFHGTWHILSDWRGARLLGRLLWGLAYQRRPGTLVLIDAPFLDLNPFDAEPANPIALVPNPITTLTARATRDLRRRLPLTAADGTVRWLTHGLDLALRRYRAIIDRPPGIQRPPSIPWRGFGERVERVGGIITVTASPRSLKAAALTAAMLGPCAHHGMDYAEVDWPNGEIQVFNDYRQRVSVARVARREVLAALGEPLDREMLNSLIWDRGGEVRRRRMPPLPVHRVPALSGLDPL
jgi:hypothetical protein